jgi:Uma2 family endonuclease
MAASPNPPFVPLEVYLRTSDYEPDAEYVDGVIEERPMGEFDHSSWQRALVVWFSQNAKEYGVRVQPELRVQTARTRFRIPDVALLDRSLRTEKFATHPPIAVFEILSPEDSMNRMMAKLADYERMGIKTIVILDPNGPHYRYVNGGLETLPVAFDLPGCAARFDLAEIEKLLD